MRPGEVHALLGENGAGKSTLMNILYGLYTARRGRDPASTAKPVELAGDRTTRSRAGIGMVHQHFMLVPPLTVAENIVLGDRADGAGALLDYAAARARRSRDAARASSGSQVDPDAQVEDLSVGEQQRVEILKALYRGADVLILDEPTAVLTPQEVERAVRDPARARRSEGKTIVFITHKLERGARRSRTASPSCDGARWSARFADRGRDRAESSRAMMVGRERRARASTSARHAGRGRARGRRPRTFATTAGSQRCDGVSFEVRAGEIVGIAGVEGNGQTELVEAHRRPAQARERQDRHRRERDGAASRRTQLLESGVGHIPEDRHRYGLVLDFTLAENAALHDSATARLPLRLARPARPDRRALSG